MYGIQDHVETNLSIDGSLNRRALAWCGCRIQHDLRLMASVDYNSCQNTIHTIQRGLLSVTAVTFVSQRKMQHKVQCYTQQQGKQISLLLQTAGHIYSDITVTNVKVHQYCSTLIRVCHSDEYLSCLAENLSSRSVNC